MIHVVTAANRSRYEDQLADMHRRRWDFFIEQRKWSDLKSQQDEAGVERDEYDDDRAVYLLSLSCAGAVQGAMRLRPTDDKSLVGDKFRDLLDPQADGRLGRDVWEITRVMRTPEFRDKDGEIRLQITCAGCEFALSRGIKRYVAVIDTFLLPAMRALNGEKHRVLGLPRDYAEGEMIAVELRPDTEWLAMCRKRANFDQPVMFELPPPAITALTPQQEAEAILALRRLPKAKIEAALGHLGANASLAEVVGHA